MVTTQVPILRALGQSVIVTDRRNGVRGSEAPGPERGLPKLRKLFTCPLDRGRRPARSETPVFFACNRTTNGVFFQAVARDSKDAQQRGESPLNQGSFGSGPAAQFMGLGLQFVLSLLLFLYLGQWVDGKLGTSPWFMILGVFTGATAAFYSMYRKLKAVEQREEAQAKLDKESK